MNVFLAGATGVIGRPSIRILVTRGHRVFAMTREERLQGSLWEVGLPVVQDVFDASGLARAAGDQARRRDSPADRSGVAARPEQGPGSSRTQHQPPQGWNRQPRGGSGLAGVGHVVARQLSCEPLADVPGKSVTTALVVFPQRAYTATHRRPGSVTAYVVSGSIRSQMDATAPNTYPADRPGSRPR